MEKEREKYFLFYFFLFESLKTDINGMEFVRNYYPSPFLI